MLAISIYHNYERVRIGDDVVIEFVATQSPLHGNHGARITIKAPPDVRIGRERFDGVNWVSAKKN